MRTAPCIPKAIAGAGLALLCSCATREATCAALPPETSLNYGAGRGDLLFATLRLGADKDLLFALDTGAPSTVLDKSLEPALGKRLGTKRLRYAFYGAKTGGVYAAPRLYLGNTRLSTGARVCTDDLGGIFHGRPVMGILGMDCLRHYCLQLDFTAGKLRFLDPDSTDHGDWGSPFPLTTSFIHRHIVAHGDFFGVNRAAFCIDTGTITDGMLAPHWYRRVLQRHQAVLADGMLRFPQCEWNGAIYTNLVLREYQGLSPSRNIIGLGFLGKHLVTLDFPRQKMYLKFRSLPRDERPYGKGPEFNIGWWDTQEPSGAEDQDASLAQRIMSAPNLHPRDPPGPIGWSLCEPESKWLKVSVGSPPIRLSVGILPPCDYHLKVSSSVQKMGDGDASLVLEGHDRPKNSGPALPIPQRGTVVLLHDYNLQKEFMAVWAFELAQAGYRVILVDVRGHGESTGQTVSYGKWETDDLKAMLDYLTSRRWCERELGVLGVGYGACLALQWAARDSRVGTVVAIAPYNRVDQVLERMAQQEKAPVSAEALHAALDSVARQLGINWADWSGEAALRRLTQPVLLIGGEKDPIATASDLRVLGQASPAGSRSIFIPEANHQFIAFWLHDLSKPVAAWFGEHLPPENEMPLK